MTESASSLPQSPKITFESQMADLKREAEENPHPAFQGSHFTKALCPTKWEYLCPLIDPQGSGVWYLCRKKGGPFPSTAGNLWDNYCLTRAGVRRLDTAEAKRAKTRGAGYQRYDLSASSESVLARGKDWRTACAERPALLHAVIAKIAKHSPKNHWEDLL